MDCANCSRSKHRTVEEKKDLKTRLKTIEGQVHGISNMIDSDRYCNDILIQISAITKSLKSLSYKILESHLSTCIIKEIKEDNNEVILELIELLRRID